MAQRRRAKPRRFFSLSRRLPRSVALAVLLAFVAFRLLQLLPERSSFSFESSGPYEVERVIDGDTILLEGDVRVRLIGVDTPEVSHPQGEAEPLGSEASAFTKRFLEGQSVTLRFDRQRRDRYHRVLAWVYVGDRLLNEELVKAGLSRAETGYPFSSAMKRRLEAAEAEAREAGRGMWSPEFNARTTK